MLRKFLICLATLFAGGVQTQANAASLFRWNQSVGNAVFPREMIVQTCLLTKATSYENLIASFDWATHDCQWWYPDWPYYEQVIEDQYYAEGVPGQDTMLGNVAVFPYSCPVSPPRTDTHESTGGSMGPRIQRGSV